MREEKGEKNKMKKKRLKIYSLIMNEKKSTISYLFGNKEKKQPRLD